MLDILLLNNEVSIKNKVNSSIKRFSMRSKMEIAQSIEDMELLLIETESKYWKAVISNDKENMRLYFLDRSLMKARLNVLCWILEQRGLPI